MDDKRISKEMRRLNKIFENVADDKKKLCSNLIKNAAFMAVTLEELQERIQSEGAVITSMNGNGFETMQEHPAQKSYNTMINRYSSIIRQLTELLPSDRQDAVTSAGEALAAFVAKGKPGGK